MGQCLFIVGKADVPADELVSRGWTVFLQEAVQGRGDLVSCFHFYRFHFSVLLNQELDFVLIIRSEIEKPVALFGQAFADDVLVNAAFRASF